MSSTVAHAEPKDWQYTLGEPASEARARWARITDGEELARGKEVKFSPKPAYWLTADENDAFELTDGKLSERIDDRIWFNKDAVGWQFESGSESAGGATLRVDLGSVQPVGQIAIRLLGGMEQVSLALPNGLEFLASSDGENFHTLQNMKKVMHSERDLSDFKTNFYVAEEGVAFMHAFVCAEPVQARYIVIRVMPQADIFTDQISILKAKPGTAFKELKTFPRGRVFSNGLVVMPKLESMVVTTNITTPNWYLSYAYGKDAEGKHDYGFRLKLPQGLRLSPYSEPAFNEVKTSDKSRQYLFPQIGLSTAHAGGKHPLYIEPVPGEKVAKGAKVSFTGIVDGKDSHVMEYPVQLVQIPEVPEWVGRDFRNSLGWTSEYWQQRWPGFRENVRKLGFNMLPIFPMWWDMSELDKPIPTTHDVNRPLSARQNLNYVREMQRKGFKILQIDSPVHQMVKAMAAHKAAGTLDEKEADLLYNQVDGKRGEHFSPMYRGRYYQDEVKRIADLAALLQPEEICWDIEIWYFAAAEAYKDPRAREAQQKSGKDWDTFLHDLGAEMLNDFGKAARAAVPGKKIKIGLYNSDVKNKVMDVIYDWNKIYPGIIDFGSPSLYVQGRALDVANTVRLNYDTTGKRDTIPWLSAGTYGEFEPHHMESMVLEAMLNGSGGITYYYYPDFEPMDFYYHAKALATIGKYRDLMLTGKPVKFAGDNKTLHYTCFSNAKEALLLVGNYGRSRETKTVLPVALKGAKSATVVGGKAISIRGGKINLQVPAGEFRLVHMKS